MSVGIQSFNADILKSMGRKYSAGNVKDITAILHKYFTNSFNYDFIFGYHLHTHDTVYEDVKLVNELAIPSATFYQIWLKRETCVKQKIKSLSYSDIYSQRALISNSLIENGYVNDKSDWFIRTPKAKYRFQDHKWKNGYFFGVGINSYGFANNIAYRNYLELETYINHDFYTLPISNFYQLNDEDLQKREVCLRIKIEEGIDLKRIRTKDLRIKIEELINLDVAKNGDGFVRLNNKGLCITEYISNFLIQDI
jgi:oxygen-independent coproporphyrinogen-3 oxidase